MTFKFAVRMSSAMYMSVAFAVFAAAVADAPSFEKYSVKEDAPTGPVQPVLRTRDQRMFRTQIREAARKGTNFAGHFTIAEWGCGAGCVSIAVIDQKTGNVYDAPFKGLTYAVGYKYEGGDDQLVYRKNSRLLIVRGCPNEDNCGTYYYEWDGAKLDLLKSVPAAAPKQ